MLRPTCLGVNTGARYGDATVSEIELEQDQFVRIGERPATRITTGHDPRRRQAGRRLSRHGL